MTSIIIVENNATPSQLSKAVESAKTLSTDVIVVGENKAQLELSGSKLINTREFASLGSALQSAASQTQNSNLIIADARAASFAALKRFSESAEANSSAQIELATTEISGELLQLPLLCQENIVTLIGAYQHLPMQIFRVRKELTSNNEGDFSSSLSWGLSLLVKAISENTEILYQEDPILLETKSDLDSTALVSDIDRASVLSQAVAQNNIEDLFPRHAWKEHHEESAAASYHSLAALFVRLGDTQSAGECLQLSDSLEDSPRSLALKGLIANQNGEVLGAVANLVSSLQQYETRKRNNGEHYLTFMPKDIENINSKLLAGLDALNKRQNSSAFNHFAEAIFNFDDFYSTYGVDKIRRGASN